jgi:hypothetical protein
MIILLKQEEKKNRVSKIKDGIRREAEEKAEKSDVAAEATCRRTKSGMLGTPGEPGDTGKE